MRHFSMCSPRLRGLFQPEVRSYLPLLCPTLSMRTCYSYSSSALAAFSACTLTAMPRASTNLALFWLTSKDSKVLHTPASTQTNFYTSQLLHKHSFPPSTYCKAETHFYTNQPLHRPAFTLNTKSPFHRPPFTPTSSYTNELLHTPASMQTSSTNQLSHKPPFWPPTNSHKSVFKQFSFCTNQLLQTHQLFDKPPFMQTTFYTNQLYTTFWACRPKARGPSGMPKAVKQFDNSLL